MLRKIIFSILVVIVATAAAFAQGTEFTYQGQLQNSSLPANGTYDFEFVLFDSPSGGVQSTPVQPRSGVTVTNGIFAVVLDFGVAGFLGPARYLEIRVREVGGGAYTTLGPRQIVSSSPYAIRSLNATTATNSLSLGGVAANQFVVTTDPRMTNARPPTAGSADYIQNQNAGAQAASNFNISGNGTVGGTLSSNIVNAATQYNINGSRVLSASVALGNVFAGFDAGAANTTGSGNAFFGRNAGQANTIGNLNAFFGSSAGFAITTGQQNAFFGARAGLATTVTSDNAFFGFDAGGNATGFSNSFFGAFAGASNATGSSNAFFGRSAGVTNTTGSNNTVIGVNADVGSGNLQFATAIGADAVVSNSNTVVLGRTADTVRVPGTLGGIVRVIGGTDAEPGSGGYIVAGATVGANVVIDDNEIMARSNGSVATLFINADGGDVNLISTGTGNVGIGIATTAADKLHVDGIIRVTGLGTGGGTSLCRNASGQISTCSSSLRYKTNINRFGLGLSLINQLKPITFDWKDGGMHDLGLGAEEVAAIEPLLVTYNTKGEVEGVKYDRIGIVLVNAVKEQQQIIERQQKQIDALKALVCASNQEAVLCKELH